MPPAKKPKQSESDKLTKEISRLRKDYEKGLSFKRKFLMGLVTGIGSAIGAAFIGAIIVLILFQILDAFDLNLLPK